MRGDLSWLQILGAAALLHRYGTLEALLAQGRCKEHADELRLYRWIATMDKSAPLPPLRDQTPTWAEASASALAHEWELNRLADRLDALVHPNLVDAATMAGPLGFVPGATRLIESTKVVEVSLST
jgi:hypothetical protein